MKKADMGIDQRRAAAKIIKRARRTHTARENVANPPVVNSQAANIASKFRKVVEKHPDLGSEALFLHSLGNKQLGKGGALFLLPGSTDPNDATAASIYANSYKKVAQEHTSHPWTVLGKDGQPLGVYSSRTMGPSILGVPDNTLGDFFRDKKNDMINGWLVRDGNHGGTFTHPDDLLATYDEECADDSEWKLRVETSRLLFRDKHATARGRMVSIIAVNGVPVATYSSARKASKVFPLGKTTIAYHCKHLSQSNDEYTYRYAEEGAALLNNTLLIEEVIALCQQVKDNRQ